MENKEIRKTNTMAFANLIASLIFLGIGIYAWIQTGSFRIVKNSYVQPATFPQVMIVGMLIFTLVLLVQSVIALAGNMKPEDPMAAQAPPINPVKDRGVLAALAVIGLNIVYVVLFKSLGYVLLSALVSLIIMYMIGKRNWLQMILVSFLVPLGMFLVFYKVLTVNIPMGPLQFIRDILDKF